MRTVYMLLASLLVTASWAGDAATGVIVDVSRLPLKRARFPRLCTQADETVYPPPKLCEDPNYQGFEGYQPSLADAQRDKERVGTKPLVIVPLKMKDHDPLEGSVVISDEDAALLRELNKKLKLLDKDRLAIVIGLAVVQTVPVRDATKIKPDVVVQVQFSKPLSDECQRSATLLTVTDPAGKAIEGRLRYETATKTLSFQPSSSWAAGTKYTVKVSREAEADGLAHLDPEYIFSFTTDSGEPDAGSGNGGDGGTKKRH